MRIKLIFLVCLIVCTTSFNVSAQIARELTYSENIVWQTAIRFLRVDSGYEIIEMDKEIGYALFKYSEGTNSSVGAFEMLKIEREGKEYTRVQFKIQGQPRYVESLLFNKLERKLRNEFGVAPSAREIEGYVKEESGRTRGNRREQKQDSEPEIIDEEIENNN